MPSVEIQPSGGMNPRPKLLPVGGEKVRSGSKIWEGQYRGGLYAPHLGKMLMGYRDLQSEGGQPHLGRVINEPNTSTCYRKGPLYTSSSPSPSGFLVLWLKQHGKEGLQLYLQITDMHLSQR